MKTMTVADVVTVAVGHRPADARVAASSWRALVSPSAASAFADAHAAVRAQISISAYPAAAAATFKRTARTVASPASSPPV